MISHFNVLTQSVYTSMRVMTATSLACHREGTIHRVIPSPTLS